MCLVNYLAVLGKPREEVDVEEGATVADILASAGVERHDGEIFMVSDKEVSEKDTLGPDQTLFYVPPVDLG